MVESVHACVLYLRPRLDSTCLTSLAANDVAHSSRRGSDFDLSGATLVRAVIKITEMLPLDCMVRAYMAAA